jgi:acyl-coenzyme A thioesterase PaaI-like protein
VFRAEVVKPGRTLTVCEARAYALDGLTENLIASMTGTLMALLPREERAEKKATDRAMA